MGVAFVTITSDKLYNCTNSYNNCIYKLKKDIYKSLIIWQAVFFKTQAPPTSPIPNKLKSLLSPKVISNLEIKALVYHIIISTFVKHWQTGWSWGRRRGLCKTVTLTVEQIYLTCSFDQKNFTTTNRLSSLIL